MNMIEILNGKKETVLYKGINRVKVYYNCETDDYPIHWHIPLEIIMPLKNQYTVHIKGQELLLEEGDVLIIPPGELHEINAPSYGERIIMQIDCSIIGNLKGMDSLLHMLHPYRMVRYEEDAVLAKNLHHLLTEIKNEYFGNEAFKEPIIFALVVRFFVALGRESLKGEHLFPNITINKQQEYIEKFIEICNYITSHCTEEISVESVAALAGFSKFHFSRLFKQFTGYSFYEYLNIERISYAERLFMNPEMSITDIAMQSGFNSISTFNRIFKEHKQCSPSKYKSLNY